LTKQIRQHFEGIDDKNRKLSFRDRKDTKKLEIPNFQQPEAGYENWLKSVETNQSTQENERKLLISAYKSALCALAFERLIDRKSIEPIIVKTSNLD